MNHLRNAKFPNRQAMVCDSFELYYNEKHPVSGIAPHSHSFYEFYFFLEGNSQMSINGQNYYIFPGNIILIPPDCIHYPSYICPKQPYRRFVLWIHKGYYEKYFSHTDAYEYLFKFSRSLQAPVQPLHPLSFNDFQNRIFSLIRENREKRFGKEEQLTVQLQSLVLNLSRCLFEKENTIKPSPSVLRSRICTYIDAHLSEPLSLDDLSKAFYMNKYYLSHTFKENMGISIHSYIIRQRLEACKNALTDSRSSITDICSRFGFESYSSFFRYFKKEYGLSPKQYREQISARLENISLYSQNPVCAASGLSNHEQSSSDGVPL